MRTLALTLCALCALAGRSLAQYDAYQLYNVIAATSPSTSYDLSGDGFGTRALKAEVVTLNNCDDWALYPTGTQTLTSGLTTISMDGPTADGQTDGSNGWCRINNSSSGGQTSHWWPIRAIKVTAQDGWKIDAVVTVSDVDMKGTTTETALRKAALVFGFNGNDIVNATWDLTGSSLITHGMKIEDPALGNLGFTRATDVFEWMPGVMTTYGDRSPQVPLLECGLGLAEPACAATASFDVPVEGFFVMAAMEWKSTEYRSELISVGDLRIPHGCRCDESNPLNVRMITEPTADVGECEKRPESATHHYCTPEGPYWCSRTQYTRWEVTGPALADPTRYPCVSNVAWGATKLRDFAP